MQLYVTSITASALGLLAVVLSFGVINIRRTKKVSVGDGGRKDLQLAIRAHGNFLEYAPITLILLACAEINGLSPLILKGIGGIFVVARLMHSHGLQKEIFLPRFLGTAFTLLTILGLSGMNLFIALM